MVFYAPSAATVRASESQTTAAGRHHVSTPSQTADFLTGSNHSPVSQPTCPTL